MDERLLKPGWAGELGDDELAFIQEKLQARAILSRKWGFRPSMKTRPEAAIRRVAMDGDLSDRALNHRLARQRGAKHASVSDKGLLLDTEFEDES